MAVFDSSSAPAFMSRSLFGHYTSVR